MQGVWYFQNSQRVSVNVALQKIGIEAKDVLAGGDAPNDIPMFELVGQSVAIGGCFDSLAAVASVVSPHPHGDIFTPLVNAILGD